jgi:L,D-transpeptidase-like protein/putative peptidoglycan binding protein
MRRVLVVLALPVALLAAPSGGAFAQTVPPPAPPAPPVPPPPAAGKAAFTVSGGVPTQKIRYFAPGQVVVIKGTVKPFVAGQRVTLISVRKGKSSKKLRAAVKQDRRGIGRFSFRFKVGNPGFVRFVVRHPATPQQQAFRAKAKRIQVVNWSAGEGSRGTDVLILQRQLEKIGYRTPVSGYFDDATGRAVNAFRKVNGMGRTGYASNAVYAKVMRGNGAFKAKYPRAGKHVEFDWSRQVLALMNGAKPFRVYHVSSGAPATPTVFGSWRFYRKQPGTNGVGMVDSTYFIGGYAIHGYPSVPNYPASHGCIRVPIPNAREIYDWIPLGMRIFTYV